MMNYPLTLSFKIISFGPQLRITDASGQEVMFVHQKALKLKEDVRVYRDSSKTQELYQIGADRVIDFSAQYNFRANGRELGSSKRDGMKSLWKVRYNVMDPTGTPTHQIGEDNPWIKMADAVAESIPVVGMFAGYFFNPSYTLGKLNGSPEAEPTPVLTVTKQPAFFESQFTIEKVGDIADEEEEIRLLLGVLMMTLLERRRG
jgi:hypothetical protein